MKEQSVTSKAKPSNNDFLPWITCCLVEGPLCITPDFISGLSPCCIRAIPPARNLPKDTPLTLCKHACRRLFTVVCKCKISEVAQMSIHRGGADQPERIRAQSTTWPQMRVDQSHLQVILSHGKQVERGIYSRLASVKQRRGLTHTHSCLFLQKKHGKGEPGTNGIGSLWGGVESEGGGDDDL